MQLVDAVSGAHLWAENYERTFSPDAVFELQDDLVPRIVSTVADMNGVLPHSMSEALRSRAPEQLSPYEAVLRSFGYFARVTAEELAAARSGLELAVRTAPGYADAWAMLALLCVQDYAQGFNLQPDSLASGLAAARRAVEAAPSNHLAHFGLAQALFFQKEFQSFRNAAERAVALNPMDGNSIAFLGELLTYAGDWERGCALAERAKQLNPNHPGWYWYADFYDAYRQGDYRGALEFRAQGQSAGPLGMHAALAAAYGQLGERDAAAKAVRDLLRLRPDFAATASATNSRSGGTPAYVEHLIDGLRKAGLDVAAWRHRAREAGRHLVATARDRGGRDRGAAVLGHEPREGPGVSLRGHGRGDHERARAGGGIRVASRTSAFRARKDGGDLPPSPRALSVGHVLEGSVRTSGSRLRVTAQLTDVASGYQLWSERFDRDAADVFAVQDEIAAGVVEAVKARLGPGRTPCTPAPQARNLDAYRSYLKGRHLRGVKEDLGGALARVRGGRPPRSVHAPSWTGLAEITVLAAHFGLIPRARRLHAARKALATAAGLQGESAEGLHVEAFVALLERRWEAMETAWRRAIELQPDHVLALASFGIILCTRQRLDEALPLFERARGGSARLVPLHPHRRRAAGLRPAEEALRYLEDALSFEKEDATGAARLAWPSSHWAGSTKASPRPSTGRGGAPRAALPRVLGWALATAGRKGEARKLLEELRARPAGFAYRRLRGLAARRAR